MLLDHAQISLISVRKPAIRHIELFVFSLNDSSRVVVLNGSRVVVLSIIFEMQYPTDPAKIFTPNL